MMNLTDYMTLMISLSMLKRLDHESSLNPIAVIANQYATFKLLKKKRTKSRLRRQICIFLCWQKGNCKFVSSAASSLANSTVAFLTYLVDVFRDQFIKNSANAKRQAKNKEGTSRNCEKDCYRSSGTATTILVGRHCKCSQGLLSNTQM